MAARKFSYDKLVQMIPFVIDFLDIDIEEIKASGILDDDDIDDVVVGIILNHKYSACNCFSQTQTHASKDDEKLESHLDQPTEKLVTTKPIQSHKIFNSPSSDLEISDFRLHFRMTTSMFEMLLQNLTMLTSFSKFKHKCTAGHKEELQQDPDKMLLFTLKFLGCQQTVDELVDMTKISKPVLCDLIKATSAALYELMPYYIKWPDQGRAEVISHSFRQNFCLKSVIGTIDVVQIQVNAPEDYKDFYINLQGETTVYLQTVCDHELHFLHCSTGWPGSINVAKVFQDSDLYNDVCSQVSHYFPNGSYLVGDDAYPLTEWLMKPFEDNGNLTVSQKQFNVACQNICQYNCQAHMHLMRRFPRLELIDMGDMQNTLITILVCCALHNFCLERGDCELFQDVHVTLRNKALHSPEVLTESTEGEDKRHNILEMFKDD